MANCDERSSLRAATRSIIEAGSTAACAAIRVDSSWGPVSLDDADAAGAGEERRPRGGHVTAEGSACSKAGDDDGAHE